MEATRNNDFIEDVKAALERASRKVRSKAAKEKRPLVFFKNGKLLREIPEA